MDNSFDYKLGELSAYMKETKEHIKAIELKLDDLNSWRWKVVGVTATLSSFSTVVVQVVIKKLWT